MRALFWILGLFVAAVAITLLAKVNNGYALLIVPPYRIEMSLNAILLIFGILFIASYSVIRLASHTLQLPVKVRQFHQQRKQAQAQTNTRNALIALFEGRYSKAEKAAAEALALEDDDANKTINQIIAARASHAIKDYEKSHRYLAGDYLDNQALALARLMTEAELLLDERRNSEALEVLAKIRQLSPNLTAALRLALRAHQRENHAQEVLTLVDQLQKSEALDATQANQLKTHAYLAYLNTPSLDLNQLREWWQKVPATYRLNSKLAARAAQSFIRFNQCEIAVAIITQSLKQQWAPELVELFGHFKLYGDCAGKNLLKQIQLAESWLTEHPNDSVLLLTLGRLCRMESLWGKAQSYLEASLGLEPTLAAHAELAFLLEQIDQPEAACKHYQASVKLALK